MINSTLQFQEQKRQRLVDVCHKVLIPIVCNRYMSLASISSMKPLCMMLCKKVKRSKSCLSSVTLAAGGCAGDEGSRSSSGSTAGDTFCRVPLLM